MRTIRSASSDPAAALFRKTRRQLLGWLLTHTDESFYVRELVRVSGAAAGAVSRVLEELAAAGILRRTVRGNQVFYQADSASPIFEELKGIFLKTAGLADQIRRNRPRAASRGPRRISEVATSNEPEGE